MPLASVGRGLVFQLADALGCLPTTRVAQQIRELERPDRTALRRLGLRFGGESIYFQAILNAEAMRFRGLLWAVKRTESVPQLPAPRRLAKVIETDPAVPASFYAAVGLRVLGGLALRPDRLEQLAGTARHFARRGSAAKTAELATATGIGQPALRRLLRALGYRTMIDLGGETFIPRPRSNRTSTKSRRSPPAAENHPFARLRELNLA
ncbi:MAG: hypothetical protein JO139_04990 [Alphaproteobacteria bacterium]|nr:hypothetical protein [Alphaproteobacteria bacterium]